MRILVWYWGRRGGGAQFTLSLTRAFAASDVGAISLSLSRQGELINEFRRLPIPRQEVNTYRGIAGFVSGLARVSLLARHLTRFAQATRADIVLSTMSHPWTPLIAPHLARAGLAFVPVVHDGAPHPGDREPFFDWRLGRELRAARAAVVFSEAVAATCRISRPDLDLIRMPLGAHLPDAAPAGATSMADVLFFGRIRAYKGLDLLRDAWPSVRAVHAAATLRVVGEGNAEALAPGLSALPGVTLEDRWVPDSELAALISAARLLVLPYREASQSGVIPLALALGVPVVTTDVGGLPEQLAGGGGAVVPPEPSALAGAMAALLTPEAHEAASSAARKQGAALMDWSAFADRLRAGLSAVAAGADARR